MFNRYDFKTHPNMSVDLQEAKLQLLGPKTLGTLLTKEKLLKIRSKERRRRKRSLKMILLIEEKLQLNCLKSF